MKILELFSGYGTASFALKHLGIDYECVGYSDIDKYANQCFQQNHKNTIYYGKGEFDYKVESPKELGDCTKIDPNDLDDFDLLTGGFPCQAFSVAGKGLGQLDTRGTLFNEIIRIAEVKQPRYMMLENVKGLMSKKHKATFDKIISELYRIGYFVKWKVLNTKEHGIPQNRERVFFCCFKSWTDFCNYEWPEKEELRIFLKDILEDEVDEKYYLKEAQVEKLLPNQEVSYCIDANYHKGTNIEQFIKKRRRQIIQLNNPTHSNDRVYDDNGISPCLNTMGVGNRQPFVAASRGRNVDNPSDRTIGNTTEQRLEVKTDGTSNTLSTVQKDNYVVNSVTITNKNRGKKPYDKNNREMQLEVYKDDGVSRVVKSATHEFMATDGLTIRKLTPKECFRLQGFLNDEVNLEGLSNTQQYKLAGNGQSVNVVKKIFANMFYSQSLKEAKMPKMQRLYSKISNYNSRLKNRPKACGRILENGNKCSDTTGLCKNCFIVYTESEDKK